MTQTDSAPVFHIPITGGPGGGKTSALAILPEDIMARGHGCLVAPEMATLLIMAGFPIIEAVTEALDDPRKMHALQVAITRLQLSMYEVFDQLARTLHLITGKSYIVLHDRGISDNGAYIGAEAFQALLDEVDITMFEARDRYDAVIHMVSAADGAEEHYTTENNAARTETPEQARHLDQLTRAAWHGHEHFKVIDNSTGFDEKLARVRAEVLNVIASPPKEIERKFLLTAMPDAALLEAARAVETQIEQTYLVTSDGSELRVRQSTQGLYQRWTRTSKEDLPDGSGRDERSAQLNHRTYQELLRFADPNLATVLKTRHSFTSNAHYFELDQFTSPRELVVLEVEVASLDEHVELPEWLQDLVEREVTHDKAFKTKAIARMAQTA